MIDLSYLTISVRETIVTDVVEIAKYHSIHRRMNEGSFGIPRQVFCYVDFLGSIAYGNQGEEEASTWKGVRFIEEFFPSHYRPYANLIVALWRHGTVHHFVPFVYYAMSGTQKVLIGWSSNSSNDESDRKVNMKIINKQGNKNILYLAVNICQLADDLLIAFDKFVDMIEKDPSFENECLRRLQRVMEPKNCMTLKKVGIRTKEKLRSQIFLAKCSTEGELEEKQVKWYHKP